MSIGIISSGVQIVTSGLKVWLDAGQKRSYSGTGSTWSDLSGSSNNFTLQNSPTYQTGNGGLIQYNGSNQYSTGSASDSLSIGQNFTIEIVANVIVAGGTQWGFWFAASAASGKDRGISCHFNEGGKIMFDTMGYDTSNGDRLEYASAPSTNTINYYQFRFKNDATPYKHIFLNGSNVANTATKVPTTIALGTGAAQMPGSVFNIWFNGNIYIFRVYNTALSDTQLTQNFNADRKRFGL